LPGSSRRSARRRVFRPVSERRIGDSVCLLARRGSCRRVEAKCMRKPLDEFALGRVLRAVRIADAQRHFKRELSRLLRTQCSRHLREVGFVDQHFTVKTGQVESGVRSQRIGDALDLGTLALVLQAVGKSGHQRDGQDGTNVLRIHMGKSNWSEREDSNLRPLAPHASALPDCATLRPGADYSRKSPVASDWLHVQTKKAGNAGP
jgi:hypothetical protein